LTFTATITNTSGFGGTPTGSVEFYDGLADLGAGSALSGGGASATSTFTISTLTAGSHSITATYTATGNFLGSNSNASPVSQTVNKAHLTVTADARSKTYGDANRSEERRVGKECRSRWTPYQQKKKLKSEG